jgi:putative ABC transport system ATP-binding protein
VFQKPHFINSLTVKENLQLAQYIANKNNDELIENVLKNLNILNKSNKMTNELSQGEKQRVSIALSIANSPKLILADEPTSSLDDDNCSDVIKLLKKQATDYGAQLIVITHDNRLKKHFKKSLEL